MGLIHTPNQGNVPVVAGEIYRYSYSPSALVTLLLTGHAVLAVERRYNNSATITFGPLVFALDIPASVTVLHHYQYDSEDLQLLPQSAEWSYALQLNEQQLNSSLVWEQQPIPAMPFDSSQTALILHGYGRLIDWGMEKGVAAAPPKSPVYSTKPLTPLRLIPFGATKLRLAEIPTLTQTSYHEPPVKASS